MKSQSTVLDARVNWRMRKNLDVELVGQNLLDNRHPESGTSASIRAPLVEIERSAYFKIIFRF